MEIKLPIRILALAAATGVAALAAAGAQRAVAVTSPAIRAKQAQAARVLAEISAIDDQVSTISEQYDGARFRLQALQTQLKGERVSLVRARHQVTRAEQRAANLLVWLYTSNHSSTLDVILGAQNLGEVLRLSDDESTISRQASLVAAETDQARLALRLQVESLERDQAASQLALREISEHRGQIMAKLARRQMLLRGVETQVARLQAQELAQQRRLAAEARARLAAEAAARARAAAAAAARARVAAARARLEAERRAAAEAAALAAAKRRAATEALRASTAERSLTTTPADPPATSTAVTTTAPLTTPTPGTSTETTVASTPAADPAGDTTSGPFTTGPDGQLQTTPATTPLPTSTGSTTTPAAPPAPLPAGHPEAASIALQYIGVPYLWGGESPAGFDCSGLVAYVFAQLGIDLPHFAAAQYTYGVAVPESELQPGDLVFFAGLNHVGIYIGNGQYVDAPHTGTFVRIDSMSDPWAVANYVGARRI
jgi:cell wall-associated NlpC family hydrolase